MDETLRIYRHLYGEEPDADDFERRIRETPDLARELDSMREVKAMLDEKPPQRPDASVVDAIVAEAARAASDNAPSPSTKTASPDRAARDQVSRDHASRDRSASQRSGLSRRLQQVGLAAALILFAAIGIWQYQTAPNTESTAPISADVNQQLPPAARDLPDWDEGDDVVRLHRRLEVVNARSASPSSWSSRPAIISAQSQRP
jgi:hypothetical protein